MSTVLVLDVSYQPIRVVAWEEAIVWVLERVVDVVDEYPDRRIRTPSWSVPMPSIVRFCKPIKRKRAVKFSRQNVYTRDRGRCQYCDRRVARDEFQYEHVVPRAQGGQTTWENVVVSCNVCNQYKGGRTPAQAGMHLLSTPVKPKKLAEAPFMLKYRNGMPASWKDFLRDTVYWEGELESDERTAE